MSGEKTTSSQSFATASGMLADLADGPGKQAAEKLEEVFAQAGERIGRELEKAALRGEISFSKMTESILRDMAKLAINKVIGGALDGLFSQIGKTAFGGARADGGPVIAGNAYLVGENGPEIFSPGQTGGIQPGLGNAPVNVHFHLAEGASFDDFKRSQGQIAAMLGRVVERGRKRL